MTEKELKKIEAELQRRGYHKYTTCLTSTESYAWVKSFGKEKDEDGEVTNGYQVAFRVWDLRQYIAEMLLHTALTSGLPHSELTAAWTSPPIGSRYAT